MDNVEKLHKSNLEKMLAEIDGDIDSIVVIAKDKEGFVVQHETKNEAELIGMLHIATQMILKS